MFWSRKFITGNHEGLLLWRIALHTRFVDPSIKGCRFWLHDKNLYRVDLIVATPPVA